MKFVCTVRAWVGHSLRQHTLDLPVLPVLSLLRTSFSCLSSFLVYVYVYAYKSECVIVCVCLCEFLHLEAIGYSPTAVHLEFLRQRCWDLDSPIKLGYLASEHHRSTVPASPGWDYKPVFPHMTFFLLEIDLIETFLPSCHSLQPLISYSPNLICSLSMSWPHGFLHGFWGQSSGSSAFQWALH